MPRCQAGLLITIGDMANGAVRASLRSLYLSTKMRVTRVLWTLAGVALGGVFLLAQDSVSQSPEVCFSTKDRDHVRELTYAAIDQAFQQHVGLLFSVWVKDFTPEPKRAVVGMANGISAYRRARDNAAKWNPQICS